MKKILIIILFLISTIGFSQKPTDKINIDKINIELIEKLVLEEINNYRVNYSYLEKIPNTYNHYKVIKDPKQKLLSTIYPVNSSRLHSQKMADLDKGLFHDEKDGRNYNENCTMGIIAQKTYIKLAKDIFEQWKDSRLHNLNLLKTSIKYGEVGISYKQKTEIVFDEPIKINYVYVTFRGYVN